MRKGSQTTSPQRCEARQESRDWRRMRRRPVVLATKVQGTLVPYTSAGTEPPPVCGRNVGQPDPVCSDLQQPSQAVTIMLEKGGCGRGTTLTCHKRL